jgi:PHD/YefM family antitoxin component YafN of YafNO toxin-antitoxin module
MLQAHQQITDETGNTFVLLPLEEYNSLMGNYPEDDEELTEQAQADLRAANLESQNAQTISAEELQQQLGLPKHFPVQP